MSIDQLYNDFIDHLYIEDKKRIKISEREKEILFFCLCGNKSEEIAEFLHIHFKTVKFHLTNIYKKLKFINKSKAQFSFIKFLISKLEGQMPISTELPRSKRS